MFLPRQCYSLHSCFKSSPAPDSYIRLIVCEEGSVRRSAVVLWAVETDGPFVWKIKHNVFRLSHTLSL